MRLSARGARIALFVMLIPIQIPLVVCSELGVCSDGVRRFARAYTALAFRIVAHFGPRAVAVRSPYRTLTTGT
jgi:hypothetical protein